MAKPKPNKRELTQIAADRARKRVSSMSAEHRAELGRKARKTALGAWPVPEWQNPQIDIPVQDLREFLCKYGPSVSVLVTWSQDRAYNFITIGSDRLYADAAVRLRNEIADKLGDGQFTLKEDLRGDHPNVALTLEQLDFILWLLGRIFAVSSFLSDAHQKYIEKHHDALMNLVGDAKEKLAKAPR